MDYIRGQKVRLTRETHGTAAGSLCVVHNSEGFGSYILRGPLGNEETETRLFAAVDTDFKLARGESEVAE